MERNAQTRKPHASTAELLTWTEAPPPDPESPPSRMALQPSDGVSKVVFGSQITVEEAENVLKRKPCSGPKLKEMTGSDIFFTDSEEASSELGSSSSTPNIRTGLCLYQQTVNVISQISFSDDETVSPKKPTSVSEVAKQARTKFDPALLFGEEPEVKTAKKIHTQKVAELTSTGIFKDDGVPGSAEKTLSTAKLKEMIGSDIFADGQAPSRDYLGGGSSIALV